MTSKVIERYWMQLDQLEKWLIDAPRDERITLKFKNTQRIAIALRNLFETFDDNLKTIIQMRYWDKEGCYEWEEIADKLYMSRNKVLRKRNVLIDKTAERMGWL